MCERARADRETEAVHVEAIEDPPRPRGAQLDVVVALQTHRDLLGPQRASGSSRTPVRAPRAKAIAERSVGTVRRECLDHMLNLGRCHLEAVLGEYVEHYDRHRPHRSPSQQAPSTGDTSPAPAREAGSGHLQRTSVPGGLIYEYRMVT
jgi:hypothetical protein